MHHNENNNEHKKNMVTMTMIDENGTSSKNNNQHEEDGVLQEPLDDENASHHDPVTSQQGQLDNHDTCPKDDDDKVGIEAKSHLQLRAEDVNEDAVAILDEGQLSEGKNMSSQSPICPSLFDSQSQEHSSSSSSSSSWSANQLLNNSTLEPSAEDEGTRDIVHHSGMDDAGENNNKNNLRSKKVRREDHLGAAIVTATVNSQDNSTTSSSSSSLSSRMRLFARTGVSNHPSTSSSSSSVVLVPATRKWPSWGANSTSTTTLMNHNDNNSQQRQQRESDTTPKKSEMESSEQPASSQATNNNTTTSTASSSSSLFGTVMRNLNDNNNNNRLPTTTAMSSSTTPPPPSPQTPMAAQHHQHNNNNAINHHAKGNNTTQTDSSIVATKAASTKQASGLLPSLMSPGGYRLLDIINSVITAASPFRTTVPTNTTTRIATAGEAPPTVESATKAIETMKDSHSQPNTKASSTTATQQHKGSPRFHHQMNHQEGENLQITNSDHPNHVNHDCWYETVIDRRTVSGDGGRKRTISTALGLIDWSLKCRLVCQHMLGLCHSLHQPVQHMIHYQAMNQFMLSSPLLLFRSSAILPKTEGHSSDSIIQWYENLFYWQYPSNYHRDMKRKRQSLQEPNVPLSTKSTKGKRDNVNRGESNHNIKRPKLTDLSRPTIFGYSHGIPNENEQENNEQPTIRNNEWQEAFRGLYLNWLQCVDVLNQNVNDNQIITYPSHQLDRKDIVVHSMDVYFYALHHDHTVLFRVKLKEEASDRKALNNFDEGNDPNLNLNDTMFIPEIVLSSSSLRIRDNLRDRGVRLMLLDPFQEWEGEFNEQILTSTITKSESKDTSSEQKDKNAVSITTKADLNRVETDQVATKTPADGTMASPDVRAELSFLRLAQAAGGNVGADVLISTDNGYNQNKLSSTLLSSQGERALGRIPPLRIVGFDDCASFVEVYLNTYGQMNPQDRYHYSPTIESIAAMRKGNDSCTAFHLPTLLCRRLGPFPHATIQSLRTSFRRAQSSKPSDSGAIVAARYPTDPSDQSSVVEVEGLIMPCAMRGLVAAAIDVASCTVGTVDTCATESSKSTASVAALYATSRGKLVFNAHSEDVNHSGRGHSQHRDAHDNSRMGTIGDRSSKFMNSTTSKLWDSIPINSDTRIDGYVSNGQHDQEANNIIEYFESCRGGEVVDTMMWYPNQPNSVVFNLSTTL